MTLQEAHSLSLKVLKQVMEEKLDENNVQLAQVGSAGFQERRTRYSYKRQVQRATSRTTSLGPPPPR
jgi:hypothetical protein